MLNRFSIGTRIQVIVLASLFGILVVAMASLIDLRTTMLEDRQTQIKQLVDSAASIVAVYHERAAKGEISDDDARRAALDTLRSVRYAGDNYLWVNSLDGVLLMHPFRSREIGTSMLDLTDPNGVHIYERFVAAARDGGGFVHYAGRRPGAEGYNAPKIAYVKPFSPWGWGIGTGIYIDDVDTAFRHDALALGGIGAIVMMVVIGVTIVIARSVIGPLARLTRNMLSLARGDSTIDVGDAERRDEVGALAGAMITFRQNFREMETLRAEQEQAKRRSEDERCAMTRQLADTLDGKVARLVEAMAHKCHELRETAEIMTGIAAETSHQASTVAAASREASANVQTVATAATELSTSIDEIGRQMARSTVISTKAVAEAMVVNQSFAGLTDAAQKIGKVVDLITAIACQTNLLALNATIEAARAGEAGKGFAVVASEVKSLASQTANATDEIASQVTGIQTVAEETAAAIQSITRTIGQLNEIATIIAAAVEQQGAATGEISRNVEQAAVGTQKVSSTIAAVDSTAHRSGDAAHTVLTAATDLAQQAQRLRHDVQQFLTELRQA